MPKVINSDGSLDPARDFADDGASFRVRREQQLDVDPYLQEPKNVGQAVGHGIVLGLRLLRFVVFFVIAAIALIVILAELNIIQ